jgi:hypothetical protein
VLPCNLIKKYDPTNQPVITHKLTTFSIKQNSTKNNFTFVILVEYRNNGSKMSYETQMDIAGTDLKPYILPSMNHFKCIPNLLTCKKLELYETIHALLHDVHRS